MGVSRFKIRLYLITICLCVINASEHGPNITILYEDGKDRIVCVASGDETINQAQTFIVPLTEDYAITNFNIVNMNIEKYNCDFESQINIKCDFAWWYEKNFVTRNSQLFRFHPILDNRWNYFTAFRTRGSTQHKEPYKIVDVNFHVSISIRGRKDAQILLCKNKEKWDKSPLCYWILIDAFTDNKLTAIRKCIKGVPDDFPKDDEECKMHRDNITLPKQILNEYKWRHFTITRENNNRILLWESKYGDKPLLNFTDYESPININYLNFRSYKNSIVEWKIHDYNFIEISQEQQNRQIHLGPNINLMDATEACFSMYVALCSQCKMNISLEVNGKETTEIETIEGTDDLFIEWKHIRINTNMMYLNSGRQFYVNINIKDNFTKAVAPFWAIDDFRLCSSKDIKYGSIQIKNKQNLHISCESLQYPEWNFSTNNNEIITETLQCSDPEYTGKYCDIKCNSINRRKQYCENQKICIPTKEDYNLCTCASGSYEPYCSNACVNGFYGYNCGKKCGICRYRYCDKFTGICDSCNDHFQPPFCNTTIYPRLVEAPTILNTGYNSIQILLNDTRTEGEQKANKFQIQYKTMDTNIWNNFGKKEIFNLPKEIEITGLEKETLYVIRAILYTEDDFCYDTNKNIDFMIPQVETRTMCDAITMELNPGPRNINITVNENNFSCALINYHMTINTNGVTIQNYEQVEDIIINKLKPHTTYEVVLKYNFFPFNEIRQNFTTLEDAPSIVNNIKYETISDTEVSLTWEPPFTPNGIIRQYIIVYKHLKYLSCSRYSYDAEQFEITVSPELNNLRVTLKNLKPYSSYQIQIAAKTTIQGKYLESLFETNGSSFISNEELFTSWQIFPSSTSVAINWELPNCEQIKGPLDYQIIITCKNNDWCNRFQTHNQTIDVKLKWENFYSLIPFTHYKMVLKALRKNSRNVTTSNNITKEFDTLPGIPLMVRNLTVYSRDENSIAVKWLPAYPPNGQLNYYEGNTCYYSYYKLCKYKNPSIINTIPCDLWEENYTCYSFTNLYTNSKYKISIGSRNKNVAQSSTVSEVTSTTQQGVPSKPLNLNHKWMENILTLNWNHPDIPNGPIKYFLITLTQNETEIDQNNDKIINRKYEIKKETKSYTVEIDKFPFSSSYVITVCAYTIHKGEPATLIIHTPPEIPELSGQVFVKEHSITNTTVKIEIPAVIRKTKSKTSVMFVVVSNLDTNAKQDTNTVSNSSDLKQAILKYSSGTEKWIAVELALNDMKVEIEIGDGRVTRSDLLKESIVNKMLEPETNYGIDIILINTYNITRSLNHYKLVNVRTAKTVVPLSMDLHVLLLIIIVPIILLFLLSVMIFSIKRCYNKHTFGTRFSVFRQGNHHDFDIIPLTGDTTNCNLSRNNIAPRPEIANTTQNISDTTQLQFSHNVKLKYFSKYVKESFSNGELERQHSQFKKGGTKPWSYGMLTQNIFKNRYNNLTAYDHSRVILEKIGNDPFSDFINANYIDGYKQKNAYIATQGPKLNTINDFWRMIWQENVQYIVMLTNLTEGGKKKFDKYWPEIGTTREFINISVTYLKSDIYADFEYRTFEIQNDQNKRLIQQLHFTSWPDHEVPLYPQSLVPFLKKIQSAPLNEAPIVVHCSTGTGRTGIIILVDICLRMAKSKQQIDVFKYLHSIREQRANMVYSYDQYKFVHMILLEYLFVPIVTIPCDSNMAITINKMIKYGEIKKQIKYLEETMWYNRPNNTHAENYPENSMKNRFLCYIPSSARICLSRYPESDQYSDYINAIPVDGFRIKEQFIVTQNPLPNTVKDFWRMVHEHNCKVIVSLNSFDPNDKSCNIFWPTGCNEDMKPMPHFIIKYQSEINFDYYNVYKIQLINENAEEGTDASSIKIIQFKNWKRDSHLPQCSKSLICLFEEAQSLSRDGNPMIVTCFDGATACGIFVALSFVIEKIKLEQICDVCLATRVVRCNREQFIINWDQFVFLYKSALEYVNSFDEYANFQGPAIRNN